MATNSNLEGSWKIKAAGFASGITSVPHFQVGYRVEITDTSLVVYNQVPNSPPVLEVSGEFFKWLGTANERLKLGYEAGAEVHTAYIQYIPPTDPADPNSVAAILGGSTVGDPDTVAVWGGDDRP